MAIASTTLSAAVGALDKSITVASATSMAAGRILVIDGEVMQATKDYVVASTTVPVLRGQLGSASVAHVASARVVHGTGSDFATAVGTFSPVPIFRPLRKVSVSATSSLALPNPGEDLLVELNGSAITLTIPVPTADLDGCKLYITANTVAQHVLTITGGISGVGAGYTTLTTASGAIACYQFIACNALWHIFGGPTISGTVTKIQGAIS